LDSVVGELVNRPHAPIMRRISDLSIEENAAPKRRSSAGKRRRSRKASSQATQPQVSTATSVATAEAAEAEGVRSRLLRRKQAEPAADESEAAAADRNVQRRDERRRAKQTRQPRRGVGRIVNTERMGGLQKFYNDTGSEIRKVVWPDQETTRNLTIVVIAMSIVMGILLGGIDFVLLRLFEALS
jgi:preprotein translocase subunit SecE